MKTQSSSSSSSSLPPSLLSSYAKRRLLLSQLTASSKARGRRVQHPVDYVNRISTLPDELLQKILSTLSTKDAVKTSALSTRWVDLWKERPDLCVDMRHIPRTTSTRHAHMVSQHFAESVTRTINNHCGHLESCTIHHYLSQCSDGTLQHWIQKVVREKETKELKLVNHIGCVRPINGNNALNLVPSTFSHPSLTSLSLCRYRLTNTKAFKDCCNLKTLKLLNIMGNVTVFSKVFAACPSLEVLVLRITSLNRRGELKIENNNLVYLQVSCPTMVDMFEVNASRLEILDMRCSYWYHFVLDAPKIQSIKKTWIGKSPSVTCNISSLAQEKKSVWLELMASEFHDLRRTGSLAVSLNVKNPKELEIFNEVLLLWGIEMNTLEITFKNNDDDSGEEGGCAILLDDAKPFPDALFRVYNMQVYNFNGSNKEEYALLSRFVTQDTVLDKMMIETSSLPPIKKLVTEAAIAKLMDLPTRNEEFAIDYL